MFELTPNLPPSFGFFRHPCPQDDNANLVYRAMRLFNRALSRGRFARFKGWITGRSGCLLDLNNLHGMQFRAQYYGGVRAVALKKICGSLGRTGDFDCDFNPLDSRLSDRWQSIAMACLHHTVLEPVDLIQVDDCYFVQDGHHRISVAHALGKVAIDAEVTVWVVPETLPRDLGQYAESQIQIAQTVS
jgi:hypothetical protein